MVKEKTSAKIQATATIKHNEAAELADICERNPDLELKSEQSAHPSQADLVLFTIYAYNLGKITFHRRLILLLSRALWSPPPREYDPQHGMKPVDNPEIK